MKDYDTTVDYERKIMADPNLDDMEKLLLEFNLHKEELKIHYPQVYYCLLAVADKYKQNYRLTKVNENPYEIVGTIQDKIDDRTYSVLRRDGSVVEATIRLSMMITSKGMGKGDVVKMYTAPGDKYVITSCLCASRRYNKEEQYYA